MPLKNATNSNVATDWAAAYKQRLALLDAQKRAAMTAPTRGTIPTNTTGSSIGSNPLSRISNPILPTRGVLGPLSQRSGSTGSGTASSSTGSNSTYSGSNMAAAAAAINGQTNNGIPSVTNPNDPSTATPPNETAPGFGDVKDQKYNYGAGAAWGNGKGITSNSNWANGISDTMLQTVLDDSQQTSAQWAKSQGYGQGIEGALNRYADPTALALLGSQGALGPTGSETAGFIGGFNDAAMKSTGGTLINPKGVIQRVLSASGDIARPDALGQRLYGATNASNPAAQVADTLKFLQATLTGTMANSSLDSYLSMLERMGREFLAWKSTPAGVSTASNFGNYILQQTGGTGGWK